MARRYLEKRDFRDSYYGNLAGSWAFLIGVILAIIFGIISGFGIGINPIIITILVIIGMIVGFFNISVGETTPFLLSGAVLIIASALGQNQVFGQVPFFSGVLNALLLIFVPATIIVAIKNVFSMARD